MSLAFSIYYSLIDLHIYNFYNSIPSNGIMRLLQLTIRSIIRYARRLQEEFTSLRSCPVPWKLGPNCTHSATKSR